MPTPFRYSLRCTRALPELAAPILARQGQKQNAPIRRIRDDRDIRQRVNIERVLQRSLKSQTESQIGIRRSCRRQSQYRPDLLAQKVGHGYRMAGGIRAHQRAGQIIVRNRSRIDADAERRLDETNRIDDVRRVARA